MNTRASDILINIPFSVISAVNAYFVRAEKIDMAFKPDDPNYRLLNIISSLINMLSMPPEYIYNTKRNTYLSELLSEIKGEDEKKEPASIFSVEAKQRESRLARRRASAPSTIFDDRQFDHVESQLFSPGGKIIPPLEIEEIDAKREAKHSTPVLRNIFTGGAILVMSFPVAVGHFVLFYDATEKMFVEKYKNFFDKDEYGTWPIIFSLSLGFSGATLEWLRGGLELAAGASRIRPTALFANSHTEGAWYLPKNILRNIITDIGANVLVSFAMFAEFALFMSEFEERIIVPRFLGMHEQLLTLISISLSMMSASMYLGHEGQMFFKIKKAAQKLWADEVPYQLRLIQYGKRFSQHARCEKNTIVLYQEEGSLISRWRKGNTIYREALNIGRLEEKKINEYFSEMKNSTKSIGGEEEHDLVMHIAQVSGLTRYTRQEHVARELYFLGSILNAAVHGISRYAVLKKIGDSSIGWTCLALSIATVSAASRLATLCIDEEEFVDENLEEEIDNSERSLKYDARQRGKDVIYETCFIILIALGTSIPNEKLSSTLSHQMVVMGCGVLAGGLNEMTLIIAHRCHDKFVHEFNLVNFTIDTIVAPASSVFLASLLFSNEEDFFADAEWVSKSSLAVMMTLVLRHLFKKFYPVVKNGLQRGGECLYSRYRDLQDLRRNKDHVVERKDEVRENKTDKIDSEQATESTALLSSTSQSRISPRDEEREGAHPHQRHEQSCGDRLMGYVSSWYNFFSSRSPGSERQQHNPQFSPARRARQGSFLS